MLHLISMDFYNLNNVSFNKKKAFLNELKELLQKYQELPTIPKQIEEYYDSDDE